MFFRFKYHIILYLLFFILIGCKLQEPSKNHGILFLKNRSDLLILNASNKNDVVKIIGQPHSKSVNDENEWMYFERILTKGDYHKLGQNVLKTNNVLVLNFDKYGILKKKNFLDKKNKREISFSEKETQNELTKESFVKRFLNSVRSKMYRDK
tara:strand:- start:71 stop:529 length:459 start_codon:yes stop_codon:yes gene_type:complete